MEVANAVAELPHNWCKTTVDTPSTKDHLQMTFHKHYILHE